MSTAISHTRDDAIRWAVWKVSWVIATATLIPPLRLDIRRHVEIPRRGPLLLVSNHPSPWDPIAVPWSVLRQVHNLGTDQLLRVPYFGWMMPYFSMIPFKKGMKDPTALAELERRVRNGDCCMIFPEGDRTWTGRSNPVKPGTGRMIKRLGVPVGFIRITTGHMVRPRWAKRQRSVPMVIEHTAVETYPDSMSVEDINADVARRISVDPYAVELPPRSFGRKLAVGFPAFMWACPLCFAHDRVRLVDGDSDAVTCDACESVWRITIDCWMRGEGGPAEDIHIDEAYGRVIDHFGALPILDQARHAQTGVKLEGEVDLDRIHYGKVEAEALGFGTLELFEDHLEFTDRHGHAPLVLPFAMIKAVLLQVGNKLQIRTDADNFQINPINHSTNMWKYFIDRHLRAFRKR